LLARPRLASRARRRNGLCFWRVDRRAGDDVSAAKRFNEPPQLGFIGLGDILPRRNRGLFDDRRIVDDQEADTFLVRVKDAPEDPARLVLDL
jgi:hypothetical protein